MQRKAEATAQKQRQEEERLVRAELLQEQVRTKVMQDCDTALLQWLHLVMPRTALTARTPLLLLHPCPHDINMQE